MLELTGRGDYRQILNQPIILKSTLSEPLVAPYNKALREKYHLLAATCLLIQLVMLSRYPAARTGQ